MYNICSYCGLENPSWSELRHFVYFLYDQLYNASRNPWCQDDENLPGFKIFVVTFMIRMAMGSGTNAGQKHKNHFLKIFHF